MNERSIIITIWLIALIAIAVGYYFKGMPMAVSVIVGEYIIWSMHKRKQAQLEEEAASKREEEYYEE